MKRFVSKHEKARKEKRKQAIIGISLTVLMFLSVMGFAFQFGTGVGNGQEEIPEQDRVVYNGVEFVYNNGFWTVGGFAFRHNPEEVPNIEPEGELKNIFSYEEEPLYIYSESSEARSEINVNLRPIVSGLSSGCPEDIEEGICPEETPVKSCDEDNFIIIREDTESTIRQENRCVFIEGPSEDLTLLTDQFLFKLLEIR